MTRHDPDEAQVLGWFEELSNWGRWGTDDVAGTLNLVDEPARLAAIASVRSGRTIGCGRPVRRSGGAAAAPTVRFMTRSGADAPERGMGYAEDWWGLGIHGFDVTHLDAPAHVFWDGRMYNDRAASVVSSPRGARFGDVTGAGDGIVTRGVVLDLPRHRGEAWLAPGTAVGPAELEACAAAAGVEVRAGDALLVRTGRDAWAAAEGPLDLGARGTAGLHASCLPWLHARGVALVASDVAADVLPSGYRRLPMPLHAVGIVAMGLWLLDNAWLEELAAAAAALDRHEVLFVVSPLRLVGGTGSPVNPVAVL